jgi:hypothetical protein
MTILTGTVFPKPVDAFSYSNKDDISIPFKESLCDVFEHSDTIRLENIS